MNEKILVVDDEKEILFFHHKLRIVKNVLMFLWNI